MLASILTIYNYDDSIFDDLTLPTVEDVEKLNDKIDLITDPPELNKELLIDNILMECAEMSLVYPDPEAIKYMVKAWSKINFKTWLDLYATMLYKYNPIWNKDGSYTETRTLSRTDNGTASTSGSSAVDGDLKHNVTGYDTNSYAPNTQELTDNSATFSNAGETSDSRAETESFTHTEAGNIGVTTTQQMIREQREIVEFNIYEQITQSFKRRFCIMVY